MCTALEKGKKKYCEFNQLEKGNMTLKSGKNAKWQNLRLEMLVQPHYAGLGTLF